MTSDDETEANEFACTILMPEVLIMKEINEWRGKSAPDGFLHQGGFLTTDLVDYLCKKFKVHPMWMMKRLHDLRIWGRNKISYLYRLNMIDFGKS